MNLRLGQTVGFGSNIFSRLNFLYIFPPTANVPKVVLCRIGRAVRLDGRWLFGRRKGIAVESRGFTGKSTVGIEWWVFEFGAAVVQDWWDATR